MKAFLIYDSGLGPGRLTGVKAAGLNRRRRNFVRGEVARKFARALRAAGADIIAADNIAARRRSR